MKNSGMFATAAAAALAGYAVAQPPANYSEHAAQAATGAAPAVTQVRSYAKTLAPVHPEIDSRFVVMGYVQSTTPSWQYRWQDLTHLAIPFTDFDSDGNLTNLSSSITNRTALFKTGGIADAYGVKILMTLRNSGFDAAVLESVMPSATNRATLIQQIAAAVNNPNDNIAGLSLDFEPQTSVSTAGNAAIITFITELRAALNPGKVITWYVGPTYTSGQYPNFANSIPSIDFYNFSCYPWSGSFSSSTGAIAPRDRYTTQVNKFLQAGVPANKMVLVLPAYGYSWLTSHAGYNQPSQGGAGSAGYAHSKFVFELTDVLRASGYQAGAESPWFSTGSPANYVTTVCDDEDSLRIKMADVLNWPGPQQTGSELRGVGFWSLMWMANDYFSGFNAYDLDAPTPGIASKTRTYPHIYQAVQELLHPADASTIVLEKWEGDPAQLSTTSRNNLSRWRTPSEGPDTVGMNAGATSISVTDLPEEFNAPANSAKCQRINFGFTATAGSRMLYRWEILGDSDYNTIPDRLATCGFFDLSREVRLDVYSPTSEPACTMRMVLMDAKGELEMGPATPLDWFGWRTIRWDLTREIPEPYNTNFNQYKDGDGVLNVSTEGAQDISFIGVLLTGNGTAVTGTLYIDELRVSAPADYDEMWMFY